MYGLYKVGSFTNPYLKDINHNKDIDLICIVKEENVKNVAINCRDHFLNSFSNKNKLHLDFKWASSKVKVLLPFCYQLYYAELVDGEEIKEFRDQYLNVLNYSDEHFNEEISVYFKQFNNIFHRYPYKLYMFLMNYYIRRNKSFELNQDQIENVRYIYNCKNKDNFIEEKYQNILNTLINIWGK